MTQTKFTASKKIYFLITCLFLQLALYAQETPSPLLAMVREEMPAAFTSESESIRLNEKLKNVKNPEPLLKGYQGASYIARARYAPLFDKRIVKHGYSDIGRSDKRKA